MSRSATTAGSGCRSPGRTSGTPRQIPEDERDYYLERIYPAFGNLVPRDIASRAAKNVCDEGRGVGPGGLGVYLDFADAIKRLGRKAVEAKYGNLFDMYAQITGENPYETPMRIYPAVHYTMGGLWVDYDLESTIPGLFVAGEANFSDHGANRLGASALMQGLADGYFVLPYTIANYLADGPYPKVDASHPAAVEAVDAVKDRIETFLSLNGSRTVDSFHKELGHIMWDYCGMERTEEGLRKAITRIRELRKEFWSDVRVLGTNEELNQALERAGRVADFIELGELMCIDALVRRESCGGHFRAESQTEDGEALRHDDEFAFVSAWEWGGDGGKPILHKEPLAYEYVEMKQTVVQVRNVMGVVAGERRVAKRRSCLDERASKHAFPLARARGRHDLRAYSDGSRHEDHRQGVAAADPGCRRPDGQLRGAGRQ